MAADTKLQLAVSVYAGLIVRTMEVRRLPEGRVELFCTFHGVAKRATLLLDGYDGTQDDKWIGENLREKKEPPCETG